MFSFQTEYAITMPNMYARGILFGKMVLELGDSSVITNEKNNLSCEVQFKTKVSSFPELPQLTIGTLRNFMCFKQGMFSGTYNGLGGKVKKGSTELGEVSGTWSQSMSYKTKVSSRIPTRSSNLFYFSLSLPHQSPVSPSLCD